MSKTISDCYKSNCRFYLICHVCVATGQLRKWFFDHIKVSDSVPWVPAAICQARERRRAAFDPLWWTIGRDAVLPAVWWVLPLSPPPKRAPSLFRWKELVLSQGHLLQIRMLLYSISKYQMQLMKSTHKKTHIGVRTN